MSNPQRSDGNEPNTPDTEKTTIVSRPITGVRHPETLIDGPEPQPVSVSGDVQIPISHEEVVVDSAEKRDEDEKPDKDKAKGGIPEKQPKPAVDTTDPTKQPHKKNSTP